MMMDPPKTCHACGDRREACYLSVAKRVVDIPSARNIELRAYYCNDRPDCLQKIPNILNEWTVTGVRSVSPAKRRG